MFISWIPAQFFKRRQFSSNSYIKKILKSLRNLAHSKTCVKIQKADNSQSCVLGQTGERTCVHKQTSRPVRKVRRWDAGVEVNQWGRLCIQKHPSVCLQRAVRMTTRCKLGNMFFPLNALSSKFHDLIEEVKCRSKYDT